MIAIDCDHEEMVDYLISNGANVNFSNSVSASFVSTSPEHLNVSTEARRRLVGRPS